MGLWSDLKAEFTVKPFPKPIVLLEDNEEVPLHPVQEKLVFRMGESKRHPNCWRVEAKNEAGEFVGAVFIGPDAELRATSYAQSMNEKGTV